ncbi:MAG TPA: SRPBCC family protein, partial [Anaerolineae bacterium]|nr:SRPBCC family protein [Anaerolineae bacterium]
IEAPVEAVWALLQDVHGISSCVPGVEKVEEVRPDTYNGVLKIKIGPIGAAFVGQVTVIERTPTERLVAEVSGQDKGSASLVKAIFTGQLSATETGTHLDYEMDIALRGRLAQFGLTVVQATAKKMTAEFAKCVTRALAADMGQQDQSVGATP